MHPCNIRTREADEIIAKAILADINNYLVRYLRQSPTVALGLVPVRNEDGAVLADVPPVRRQVICAGIPYASMIAFRHDSKLLIGWSKRIADKQLMETRELHALFRDLMDSDVPEDSEDYQGAFEAFANRLVNFLSYQPTREVEVPFSKSAGKTAAIIRGLRDSILITGKLITSEASGPIPNEVARNLGWFIELAEKTYGETAANVAYPDQLPAAKPGSALTIL